ncbi:family 78 glycoside hydrolase catalytic domain [Parasediminibacterium sp. JCM 36343]|uniref:family 78 glycoside hydrolase catalytic domain n=1 Tax=Parasediminibacterium sp. JCM 36343 TaxID=3374279 RepID=UPI003978A9B7
MTYFKSAIPLLFDTIKEVIPTVINNNKSGLIRLSTSQSDIKIENLTCENLHNPLGIDEVKPRFSWQLVATHNNCYQIAYEINVKLDNKIIWASGKQLSEQSVMVRYPSTATPLESAKKYTWQVRVTDNTGFTSDWSEQAIFQMGLLHTTDWKAKWIIPGYVEDSIMRPSPMFRKEFVIAKKIVSATAFITAHGLYEARINGEKVGDAYLTPGWTSYNKRLQYQVYDVTNMIKKGANAFGVVLGSGWYRGHLTWKNYNNIYGKDIALLMQVQITYADGSNEIIVTNESWKSSTGAIRYSEIYDGEIIDSRLEKKGWDRPNYNDQDWAGTKEIDSTKENLIATQNELVEKHEEFNPIKIFTTPKGEQVIDFGQNLVGWTVLKVKGNTGDTVKLYHAEVLDKNGNFYTANLRAAKAQDEYILSGGTEIFEPHFTWHGFRYVKIEGIKGEIKSDDIKAVAIYSDMKQTGKFESSNLLVNQLQHNIQWGQKGNFIDVPTDCPQRDERLGWTGDAQVFCSTAAFNMDVHNFFTKWTKDIAADQTAKGCVPNVVPNVLGAVTRSSAGWGDACTVIPWDIYLAFGDTSILKNQYNSMKAYVEYMHNTSKNNLWNIGAHFGDWLYFQPENDKDGRGAITDKYLIAQCFYSHSVQLLINAAKVLGNTADVAYYNDLQEKVKAAFLQEYATPNGRLVSATQTAYVLALNFDMLPEPVRKEAAKRLADNIKSYENHLTTGFLGTPYLCSVLTNFGYNDLAGKLLLQDTYPSWLYPVKMGATTIWERWDGQKPDSTFQTAGMNSFNHYSYGAIGDWLYKKLVGIDTYEDGVGYKHSKIQPHPISEISHASASLDTYYGTLSCSWKIENGVISIDVTIPANTHATIFIPAKEATDISENGKSIFGIKEITIVGKENEYVILNSTSGSYHFSCKY